MKNTFCFLLSLLLLVSCTEQGDLHYAPDSLVEIEKLLPTDTVHCEKIELGFEKELDFGTIDCLGSLFIISICRSNDIIGVCDLKNPDDVVFFGQNGHAANEFYCCLWDTYGEITPDSCYYWFCKDAQKNKFFCIDILASCKTKTCVVHSAYEYGERGFYTAFYKSDSPDMIVARKKLSYGDPRDNIYRQPKFIVNGVFGEKDVYIFPKIIDNPDQSRSVLKDAYEDLLRISPDRKRLVQVMEDVDMVNVLDINSGKVLGIKRKNEYDIDFFEQSTSSEFADANYKVFNRNVCLTNDKIILLRDERSFARYNDDDPSKYNRSIEVLSYTGEQFGKYQLDKPIRLLTYSDYYNCVLGSDYDGVVYKIKLPL